MMGLPYGEEIMIVGRTVWIQSTSVTERRTDGRTDRITITDTVQRRASHGKNAEQVRQYKSIASMIVRLLKQISSICLPLYTVLRFQGEADIR